MPEGRNAKQVKFVISFIDYVVIKTSQYEILEHSSRIKSPVLFLITS